MLEVPLLTPLRRSGRCCSHLFPLAFTRSRFSWSDVLIEGNVEPKAAQVQEGGEGDLMGEVVRLGLMSVGPQTPSCQEQRFPGVTSDSASVVTAVGVRRARHHLPPLGPQDRLISQSGGGGPRPGATGPGL